MKHNIVKGTETRALVEAGVIFKGLVIKLGLDVHARQITVCRQLGDATPQPPQLFTKERFLAWVRKMVEAGAVVHSCYESGVMGYTLHRELVAFGVNNIVVVPQKLSGPNADCETTSVGCAAWLRPAVGACSSRTVSRSRSIGGER